MDRALMTHVPYTVSHLSLAHNSYLRYNPDPQVVARIACAAEIKEKLWSGELWVIYDKPKFTHPSVEFRPEPRIPMEEIDMRDRVVVDCDYLKLSAIVGALGFGGGETVYDEIGLSAACDKKSEKSQPFWSALCFVHNLPTELGQPTYDSKGNQVGARWQFGDREWRVTLDSVTRLSWNVESISHVARIARRTGTPFTAAQLKILLRKLHLFLTAIAGMRVGPSISVGMNRENQPVWFLCDRLPVDRFELRESWFKPEAADDLAAQWSSFTRRLATTSKIQALELAIGKYAEGYRRQSGPYGAILALQTALELLCWQELQVDHTVISRKQYNKNSFGTNLHLALTRHQVDTSVPHSLRYAAHRFGASDGPQLLTRYRNALTHPKPSDIQRLRKTTFGARYDLWVLALAYTEVMLFNQMGWNVKVPLRKK